MSAQEGDNSSSRWHFSLHPSVQVESTAPTALVSSYFHPTRAVLSTSKPLDGQISNNNVIVAGNAGEESGRAQQQWTSRNHRKSRHRPVTPGGNVRLRDNVLQKIGNLARVEYWNISWWVAMSFTLGSVVWVVNGFAGFLPFSTPSHFGPAINSVGWSAWVGATIFELGSILGILEAWNRKDAAYFGWAFDCLVKDWVVDESSLEKGDSNGVENVDEKKQEQTLNGGSGSGSQTDVDLESAAIGTVIEKPVKSWIWFTADPKYWHEIGFLAAFSQLCAATIFWISGFTAIPAIELALSPGLLDGIFWTPQVIGGIGFIISSTLIMLETQKKWYLPAFGSLGWHIGFWNFIGAIGFTLCGALGYADGNSKAAYQSALSTFWGGWAFLIGSVLQWYEAVNPVE